ncbi:MAG: YibE/F family protein [Proteobacteria bacterium]|nr:YibE/F family protein [Pseudomonadota bacterium]
MSPITSLKRITRRLFSKDAVFALVVMSFSIGLFLIPERMDSERSTPVMAEIVRMEDHTRLIGSIRIGYQNVVVDILRGPLKGRRITVVNTLLGHLMLDRYVAVGDRALFMLEVEGGKIEAAKLVDHDRQSWHLTMFLVFAVLLVLFAGFTGIKAFISFIFTVAVLVKVLLPAILNGYNPLLVCVFLAALMASTTLVLVGGFRLRTVAAIGGVTIGMILSATMTVFVGQAMHLRGITSDYAVKLLFSGHFYLDLDGIFWGAVILSASGTLIDIAISVGSTVAEVVKANPRLSAAKLIRSGFAVGQAELSTMVSTLLLAYTGYSLFMILALHAKGISAARFLNIGFVSAVILRILSGGLGMVLVAPITAVIAGLLYHRFHGASAVRE